MIKSKVVLYLRLSQEDGDDESASITNQRKILMDYAERNNMEVVDVYIDDGVSGYTMNRPAFNKLKNDLNNDKVDVIIVKDLSRLGRHNAKVQLFLETIEESDKRVISIGDNYDTLDENSHDMVGIHTWANEKYVKDTSKKVRRSLKVLQKEGRLLCNVPYGYYKDPHQKDKCYVDDKVAHYIEQIFDMYINGNGVKEIARELTAQNVPTPTMVKKQRKEDNGGVSKIKASGIWDTSVIIKILKNEFYIGTLVLNKTRTRSIKGKKVDLPPEENLKFPNHHDPIIDIHTFQLAQEIRKNRRVTHFRGQKSKVRKNLFAGMIFCADCGHILTTSGSTSNTRYICKTYNVFGTSQCTNHAILENDILEVLFMLLEDCKYNLQEAIQDINHIIQAELKVKSNKKDTKYELIQNLDKAKKSLEILIQQKVRETLSNPEMADLINKTYSEIQNEKYKEIAALEKQINDQENFDIEESKIKGDMNIALNLINDILSTKEITKKQILMLVDKIMVHEDSGVDIYLRGNLHELCNNYFKVNETRMNKIKKYLYEYIRMNPDKFTKDACTVYVKDHGVKVNYKIISRIINEDLNGMVELREMRHGYRLTAPIEEVERILINNIVADTAECLYSNNVKYGERMESINNVVSAAESLHYKYAKKSKGPKITIKILQNISEWIQSMENKKNLF